MDYIAFLLRHQWQEIHSMKICHSKVTTTQVYFEFNMRWLETDFSKLAESYQKTTKMGKVDTQMVDTLALSSLQTDSQSDNFARANAGVV